MNLFLFLALVLLFVFLVGRLVEKARVPSIFAGLILGAFLAVYNPFPAMTASETFTFLAELGMYFLLFLIGFKLDLEQLQRWGGFIVRGAFVIILLEAIFGSLLIHFVFGYDWFISALVALSFATVGEAILVPILDEFNAVNTRLGQAIIGIGTLDDIIEVLVLILVMFAIGTHGDSGSSLILALSSLFVLGLLTYGLTRLRTGAQKFSVLRLDTLFLFVLLALFLFVGVGEYAHAAAIAALLAGIGLKAFLPRERLEPIETELRTLCYGFFAPIFFVWVGLALDIEFLTAYPLLVLLVVAVSKGTKLLGSFLVARNELGTKPSILLGIGLSVRFSTSIVIVKILFENGLIGGDLYSVLVASTMAFKFIVPVLFAHLLVRWRIAGLP